MCAATAASSMARPSCCCPSCSARRASLRLPQHQQRPQHPQPPQRRSEEHTSELQSPCNLVCRLLLEKKKNPLTHCTPMLPPTAPSPPPPSSSSPRGLL